MIGIAEIAEMDTVVRSIPAGSAGVHESTLRSWHILMKVKDWLQNGVPGDVILSLIEEMEGKRVGKTSGG